MWKPEDIRIDSYNAAVPGSKYSIRITHLPTGTYTNTHSHQSYFRARKLAEEELASLLYQTADAPCNFCNGPMPCNCEPPEDIEEQVDEMYDNWVKYSDMLDER